VTATGARVLLVQNQQRGVVMLLQAYRGVFVYLPRNQMNLAQDQLRHELDPILHK